jgi:hypothetical protein
MRVVKVLFVIPLVFLIAALVDGISAQDNVKVECPGTRVLSSAEAVTEGERVTFHVELVGGNVDRSKLEYNWTVNHARILGGQGTPVITVSTAGEGARGSITATVDINPYRDCCWVTSQTVYVRRNGERTNADLFWEWLWFNGGKLQYAELAENAELRIEIRERLDQIDPNLTLELGPKGDGGKREIIVGHKNKPSESKEVIEFVARAPNLVVFNIVFRSSILHPR